MKIGSANEVDQFIAFNLILDSIENLVSNRPSKPFISTTNIQIFEEIFAQVSAAIQSAY